MGPVNGSTALMFDFEDASGGGIGQPALRLAPSPAGLRGPGKYKVLEHRRRQAQIKARRLLELTED